jgi:metal-responsive CopG/Arc/MetJ family transcriptional regulator
MKTAISIEDDLLREADRAAGEMHLSRSRLFSVALREYLQRRRANEILQQLNRVYADGPSVEERRLTGKMKAKFRSTIKEQW